MPDARPISEIGSGVTSSRTAGDVPSRAPYSDPAVSVPQLSLPKGGGAVRGIGEKFTANPVTGTGSMVVTLFASPGRDGFGPQLSLSYDSGAGNGAFGMGWRLELPSITRKTDKGLPRYLEPREFDVFILSGSEDLVPQFARNSDGTLRLDTQDRLQFDDEVRQGYQVRRYRPRIEGLFARIERWSRIGDGDTHWRSISKDNVLTVYGRTADSRIANPADQTQVFSWLICESYDSRGNAVVYEYVGEDAASVDLTQSNERNRVRTANKYLRSVRYGNQVPILIDTSLPSARPSHVPAPDFTRASWMFELVFDYDEGRYSEAPPDSDGRVFAKAQLTPAGSPAWTARRDPFSTYRAAFEIRCYRLCRRVLMFHHFPAELGTADCLVRATELSYSEATNGSFVQAIRQSGYKRQADGTYLKRSLPDLQFRYSISPLDDGSYALLQLQTVDAQSLADLPCGIDQRKYEWVDLDGEGIAGILTEQADAWFYKANQGGGSLAPMERHFRQPSFSEARGGAQLLDVAGTGVLDLVQLRGPVPGFFPRTPLAGWRSFRPFARLPQIDWRDPNLRFVDLTGDGLADVLITSDQPFGTWYESLGEEGFATPGRMLLADDEEEGPRLVFADGTQGIFLADMSGDGLSDLVRIRQGEVSYWPNLGYGRFGPRVLLDNVPCFDDLQSFDPRRVRLTDTDGSGPIDIVYLGRDAIRVYLNQHGNSLSDARVLTSVPVADDLATVSVTDFLGRGTACLLWSSPLPGDKRTSLRYLDLMNGVKPHLLVSAVNNLGIETTLEYTSSTQFYLADKAAGTPWVTRLPFPVHVLTRVEVRDVISASLFVTRYAYHHGYFDGIEREFRGFGRVDQWDSEEFEVPPAGQGASTASNTDPAFYLPPVLTKTWFHTGVDPGGDRVSLHYEHEYFREGDPDTGQSQLSNAEFEALLLPDTVLPADLPPGETREAMRSLKGAMLRQEVYSLDDTDAAARPYSVSERNYTVELLQRRGMNRHSVFFTHARETIDYHYERKVFSVVNGQITASPTNSPQERRLADPRVLHSMVLQTDEYGNVEQSLAIAYGRRFDEPDPVLTNTDRAEQKRLRITLTDASFAHFAAGVDSLPDAYRIPIEAETRTYELVNFAAAYQAANPAFSIHPDTTTLFDFTAAAKLLAAPNDGAVDIPYEDVTASQAPAGKLARRRIKNLRTLYRSDDLTQLLALQVLEPLALPGETYRLAFTSALVSSVYQRTLQGQPVEALLPTPASVLETDASHFADRGGYVHFGGDNDWWVPSGRLFYHTNLTASAAVELSEGSAHFFRVRAIVDPFGQATEIAYDKDLLVTQTIDAVGNVIQAAHEYRVLQPQQVTDPNGNQSFAAFDALGLPVASALGGKSGQGIGDSLSDFTDFDADPTLTQLQAFVADPLGKAASLLKSATRRFVYDLDRYQRCAQPPFASTLARETHVSDLQGGTTNIQVGFVYSDGLGRDLQSKIQAEAGLAPQRAPATTTPTGDSAPGTLARDGGGSLVEAETTPRWVGKGRTVYNNKGKPVKQYEPFFSSTALYEPETDMTDSGVTPILFYDPLERVIATLHPDRSYDKALFDPWQQTRWDANDTVALNARTDPDTASLLARLPSADYPSTWYADHTSSSTANDGDKDAAAKAVAHAGTPAVSFLDSLARPFLVIADNGVDSGGNPLKFKTLTSLDIEGNQRAITDALGRVIARYDYDMISRRVHEASMESGERWSLSDVSGKEIRRWDSRGHNFTNQYDEARRLIGRIVRGTATSSDARTVGRDVLYEKTEYGEKLLDAATFNLRARVLRHSDTAGIVSNRLKNPNSNQDEAYDFKGNPLRSGRQLVSDPRPLPDWSNPPALDGVTYVQCNRFDALNRVIQTVVPHSDQAGSACHVIRQVFNEANLIERIDTWIGETVEPLALLDPKSDPPSAPGVSNIDYNARGQRVLIEYGNAVSTSYGYDPRTFRLVQLITTRPKAAFPGDCPAAPPAGWAGCQAQSLTYSYDPMGNVTRIRDLAQQTIYFRNKRVEPSADYTYDPLYRLINAAGREHLGQVGGSPIPHSYNDAPRLAIDWSGNDGNAMGTYEEDYDYDAVGNFLKMAHAGTDPANAGWVRTYAYTETSQIDATARSNRVTSTTIGSTSEIYSQGGNGYDPHGNMLKLPQLQSMQWDFNDRLLCTQQAASSDGTGAQSQADQTYYVYDSAGNRVRKATVSAAGSIDAERIYLGSSETYHSQGTQSVSRDTVHLMHETQRIALIEVTSTGNNGAPEQLVRYQHGNHLGSALLELDDNGQIISYEEYSPYGSTTYQAVSSTIKAAAKRYRYTGKERDEETGLNYHSARYYAPWLGRWVSCDPAGPIDGSNHYWFTRDNSIRLVDPAGTDSRPPQRDSDTNVPVLKPPQSVPYQLGTDLPVDSSTIRGAIGRHADVVSKLRDWAATLTSDGSTINPVQSIIDRAATAYAAQLRDYDARVEGMLGPGPASGLARAALDRPFGSWFGESDRQARHYSKGEQLISEFRTELGRAARLQGSDPGAQLFAVIARANRTIDPRGAWTAAAAQGLSYGIAARSGIFAGVSNQYATRHGWGAPPLTYSQGFNVGVSGKTPLVLGNYSDAAFRRFISGAQLGNASYLVVDRPNWSPNFNAGVVRGAIEAGRPVIFVTPFTEASLAKTYGLEAAQILGTPIQ